MRSISTQNQNHLVFQDQPTLANPSTVAPETWLGVPAHWKPLLIARLRRRPLQLLSPIALVATAVIAIGNIATAQSSKHPAPWFTERIVGMSEMLGQRETMHEAMLDTSGYPVLPMSQLDTLRAQATFVGWQYSRHLSNAAIAGLPVLLPIHTLADFDETGLPRALRGDLASVTALQSDPAAAPARRRYIGEVDYDLADVQKALKLRGYSPGAIDGIMGPRSQHAIRLFQDRHDWEGDGVISEPFLVALGLRPDPKAASPTPEKDRYIREAMDAPVPRDLVVGSIAARSRRAAPLSVRIAPDGLFSIYRVEKKLNELGFDPGKIDGVSDQHTALAIKAFENANGLPVTGIMSRRLLEMTAPFEKM